MIGSSDDIFNMIKLNIIASTNMNNTNSTNNMNYNILFTTFLLCLLTYVSNYFRHLKSPSDIFQNISINKIYSYLFKQNKVIIEGSRCFKSLEFVTCNDNLFSTRFNAIFNHIHKNLYNTNIYSLKEYGNLSTESNILNNSIYIINQRADFLIADDIYCKVSIEKENIEAGAVKGFLQIENIKIILYSYKLSLSDIVNFISKITDEYMRSINKLRSNQLFIYTYEGHNSDGSRKRKSAANWSECIFSSSRTFDNMFFDEKHKLINKIDFFNEKEAWYMEMGCPHTLGVGLSGPPGTGKTSIIKSMANKLNRHLIVIPLNKIKTTRDLTECFFEETYNSNNEENTITFDKKIIVFEDIDCMTNIVNDRANGDSAKNNAGGGDIDNNSESGDDNINTKDLISAVVKGMKDDNTSFLESLNTDKINDKLTLSFLLNLIDGIRETPGRIIIITSNYYNYLDKALIRPGRIDITLNMQNASVQTIAEMFEYFYKKPFPLEKLKLCKSNIISPAQLFNIKLNSSTACEFVDILLSIFECA